MTATSANTGASACTTASADATAARAAKYIACAASRRKEAHSATRWNTSSAGGWRAARCAAAACMRSATRRCPRRLSLRRTALRPATRRRSRCPYKARRDRSAAAAALEERVRSDRSRSSRRSRRASRTWTHCDGRSWRGERPPSRSSRTQARAGVRGLLSCRGVGWGGAYSISVARRRRRRPRRWGQSGEEDEGRAARTVRVAMALARRPWRARRQTDDGRGRGPRHVQQRAHGLAGAGAPGVYRAGWEGPVTAPHEWRCCRG